jgi:hypothetical protein
LVPQSPAAHREGHRMTAPRLSEARGDRNKSACAPTPSELTTVTLAQRREHIRSACSNDAAFLSFLDQLPFELEPPRLAACFALLGRDPLALDRAKRLACCPQCVVGSMGGTSV